MGTAQHQYQMGLIGNCNFSALIDHRASVQWLCWPRFDSSFVFGSLIDEDKGGHFSITAEDPQATTEQSYLPNTNILCTRYHARDGSFEVIDFAPRFSLHDHFYKPLKLFRKVRPLIGNPRIAVRCEPVGSYGEKTPQPSIGSHYINYLGLDEPVRLTTNGSLTMIAQKRAFTLTENIYFVLSWGTPFEGPLVSTFESFLSQTTKYWQSWVEHCNVPRFFQKEVIRSALTLKLHQYEDTGAIVASMTMGLPEIPHEGRNWDYRYCWLRDTYYTLNAFLALGHFEEMERFAHFIENLNVGQLAALQPVYRIDGLPEMLESELNLKGYLNNRPIRLGNAAYNQVQHDAYGQILLALFSLYTDERLMGRGRPSLKTLFGLLSNIEKNMELADNGVWEFRGRKSVHTYSLLFHWAGSAACEKIAKKIGNEDLRKRAEKCQTHARELIEKCYSEKRKAYTQSLGSEDLDSSLLQMVTLGYFHNQDPKKAISHLRAICQELEVEPGFLLRYKHQDDFGAQRSAFLVCSFWYIEALVQLGFVEEAQELFHKVLKSQNSLGLMSEDFEILSESQWGNFPQTYSHVGLINCAFALDRANPLPWFL